MAGQTVSVSVTAGVCDAFIERAGFPQITQTGNSIRIVIAALHYTDQAICIYPIGTTTAPVGTFPAGSYTLQVDREYDDLFNGDTIETLGILPFTVAAAPPPPVAAPSLNAVGLAGLFAALMVIGARALRRRGLLLIVAALALAPYTARAQTAPNSPSIAILISSGANAPTPQSVVNYYQAQPRTGAAPLQGLSVQNPQQVYFLLPLRASGDFLVYLQANPSSMRAQLERYVIVGYAPTADIPTALAALRADPNVEAAYVQQPVAFSSVDLASFAVGADPSASIGQYGRDALNIDAAWQIVGGYALIGDVDSGLATTHAALQQFSGAQYVGGNFIPVASYDLGNWPNSTDSNVDEEEPIPLPLNSICNPQHVPPVPPAFSGHGTHTSGLLAANGDAGLGVSGVCKHCGVAMWKITNAVCDTGSHHLLVNLNGNAIPAAITYLADTGAQVITMS